MDQYFVVSAIPENARIVDFSEYLYDSLKRLKPTDVQGLREINAREFVKAIADADPYILRCNSKADVVRRLQDLAEIAENVADSIPDKAELSERCAVRDNIYQLIELYRS